MQRIGLFGGSFDPVHLGHLLVAQAACEELQLARLYFIPASQSPFKPGREPAPAALRLRMLHLALAGKDAFEIDDQEVRRGGISYTVETVRDYRIRFPVAELYYLIGADHVAKLPQWRDAGELARDLEFVVIPRPGETVLPMPSGFRGRISRGIPIGLSASQIRERVRAGLIVDSLVPSTVAEAIYNNRLYL